MYSASKEAFFGFSCLLFDQRHDSLTFAVPCKGYTHHDHTTGWSRLLDTVKSHQNSKHHEQCYLDWKMMSYNLKIASFVDAKVIRHYQDQVEKWRDILKRYIDTLLYLSTHNIGLRGSSAMLADADRNGNFLGLLQLLAK